MYILKTLMLKKNWFGVVLVLLVTFLFSAQAVTNEDYPDIQGPYPDLVITKMELGRADFPTDSEANIPLSVTIKNIGEPTNAKFKLSVEVIEPFDGYMMQNVKPFTVPGQGNTMYPSKTGLASGETYTFTGNLYVGTPGGDKLLGQKITVISTVDSCSGEDAVPDFCKVQENNEQNNEKRATRQLRSQS